MKSFQKSKTASFITLNSADDLFVYLLMVKMIVAQISGRHLFEHWKAAHNFHWHEKVKLFSTDAANTWEQIKTLLVNFGLTVEELKNDLLLSALTELL